MQPNLRPAVLSVLALGAGLSVAANVLVAQPTIVGRAVAAWPPIALIITIDLIGRVKASRRSVSWLRVAIAWIVGGIAAVLSYGHMRELAYQHGAGESAGVFPITVDGMVLVASLCLMELRKDRPASSEAASSPPTGQLAGTAPETQPTDLPPPAVDPPHETDAVADAPASRAIAARLAVRENVLAIQEQHPDWSQQQIANAAECSVRSVRRYLTPTSNNTSKNSRNTA